MSFSQKLMIVGFLLHVYYLLVAWLMKFNVFITWPMKLIVLIMTLKRFWF